MDNIKENLKKKFDRKLNEVKAYSNSLMKDAEKMGMIRFKIMTDKEKEGNTWETSKEDLLAFQDASHITSTKEQALVQVLMELTILQDICAEFGIELGLNPQELEDLTKFKQNQISFFMVNEDASDVLMKDFEAYTESLRPLKMKIGTDQKLSEMYDSPIFTRAQ